MPIHICLPICALCSYTKSYNLSVIFLLGTLIIIPCLSSKSFFQVYPIIKPTAHDASFLAGSLAGRYYAGCAAPSQAGHNVGLASYGAGCRAGLQARCSSFVAHYS